MCTGADVDVVETARLYRRRVAGDVEQSVEVDVDDVERERIKSRCPFRKVIGNAPVDGPGSRRNGPRSVKKSGERVEVVSGTVAASVPVGKRNGNGRSTSTADERRTCRRRRVVVDGVPRQADGQVGALKLDDGVLIAVQTETDGEEVNAGRWASVRPRRRVVLSRVDNRRVEENVTQEGRTLRRRRRREQHCADGARGESVGEAEHREECLRVDVAVDGSLDERQGQLDARRKTDDGRAAAAIDAVAHQRPPYDSRLRRIAADLQADDRRRSRLHSGTHLHVVVAFIARPSGELKD